MSAAPAWASLLADGARICRVSLQQTALSWRRALIGAMNALERLWEYCADFSVPVAGVVQFTWLNTGVR